MLYRYDKKQLVFRSLRLKTYLKIISFTILVFGISSFASYKLGVDRAINGLTEFEKVTIIKKQDSFDQENTPRVKVGRIRASDGKFTTCC